MKLRPVGELVKEFGDLEEVARITKLAPCPVLEALLLEDRKATVEACKAAAKEMGFTHGGPKGLLAALDAVLEEK